MLWPCIGCSILYSCRLWERLVAWSDDEIASNVVNGYRRICLAVLMSGALDWHFTAVIAMELFCCLNYSNLIDKFPSIPTFGDLCCILFFPEWKQALQVGDPVSNWSIFWFQPVHIYGSSLLLSGRWMLSIEKRCSEEICKKMVVGVAEQDQSWWENREMNKLMMQMHVWTLMKIYQLKEYIEAEITCICPHFWYIFLYINIFIINKLFYHYRILIIMII